MLGILFFYTFNFIILYIISSNWRATWNGTHVAQYVRLWEIPVTLAPWSLLLRVSFLSFAVCCLLGFFSFFFSSGKEKKPSHYYTYAYIDYVDTSASLLLVDYCTRIDYIIRNICTSTRVPSIPSTRVDYRL